MSLLEGGADHRAVFPVGNPYGEVLPELAVLPLDGAMDVEVNETGTLAYIAARDALTVVDLQRPGTPTVVGTLGGTGAGRQIVVHGGIAYLTARADGLFLCDVSDPAAPRLLCQYDTVELATGVCVSGPLCFVTCRHLGVEILDVTDPTHPLHLSSVLAGEAQSVFVDGDRMYVGAWISREILIFDISDPRAPRQLSACPLDGFGDGVFVRGNLCFAATGHHSRRLVNRRKYAQYDFVTAEMLSDGYGAGHGLELFDVSEPAKPRLLSRLKTPPFFGPNDMWDVVAAGNHAFLADTHNGVFAIDVRNPEAPSFAGYRRLAPADPGRYFRQPPVQQFCEPVNGIAVANGLLLAVSNLSGLHVLDVSHLGETTVSRPAAAMPRPPASSGQAPAQSGEGAVVFRTEGQVHAAAFVGGRIVVAAGGRGLVVLDEHARNADGTYRVLSAVETPGIAMDVRTDGSHLYVAEGIGGLSVWSLSDGGPREVSRCREGLAGESARQVMLYGAFGLAALHIGIGRVAFYDISNPERPSLQRSLDVPGMLYYKNIAEGVFQRRCAAVARLTPATAWYDLERLEEMPCPTRGPVWEMCPIEEGIALAGGHVLTIVRGKYHIATQALNRCPEEERITVTIGDAQAYARYLQTAKPQAGYSLAEGEVYLSGRPKVIGRTLFLLNRMSGVVSCLDVAELQNPVWRGCFPLGGNPEDVWHHRDAYWFACGHGGLVRLEESQLP